ncbi:MAG TPA: formylglycine-generating enzyme family protein [Verrucomicrobiae bacterium]|nr:formylglycine-generating enzyme family protein [Verrucomicrobiae bacterium]
MASDGKTKRRVVLLIGAVAAIAAIASLIDRLNYWYRQQWHYDASLQDLPPVDRSHWPTPPVAWSKETVEVQAATPDGLKPVHVTYYVNSIGMKLVRIEPGTFMMGLPKKLARRVGPAHPVGGPMYTQHRVTLTKPYCIGAFEVTNKQFDMFDTGHKHRRPFYQQGPAGDQQPVEPVHWQEAQLFCRWLSEKEGRLYGLPTEAQWEYACRAGTTNRTYWGDNVDDRTKANVGGIDGGKQHLHWADDGYEYTAPVGSFPPNPWGLYDMIGNAREWVADWYAPFTSQPAIDPVGPPTGHCRANKSDGWINSLNRVCSAYRDGDAPHDVKDVHGFRVSCAAD